VTSTDVPVTGTETWTAGREASAGALGVRTTNESAKSSVVKLARDRPRPCKHLASGAWLRSTKVSYPRLERTNIKADRVLRRSRGKHPGAILERL
jgi:hypothetical protein